MIVVIIISVMFAGTILAPIQSYARSKCANSSPRFNNINENTDRNSSDNNNNPESADSTLNEGSFLDIPSLKQGVHDEIRADLKNTNQSISQKNLCFRSNTCRQSAVGQNTIGDDNSVTGFAYQSQQSALLPTATLTVTKIVAGRTTAVPPQFTMHVTGNNPNPPNFVGSSTGIDVTLGSGPFKVTETVSAGSFFTNTTAGDCTGTITAGQHLSCTITNTAKTCVDCFTSLFTTAQITVLLNVTGTTSIEAACTALHESGIFLDESEFRGVLVNEVRVDVTTTTDLIDCLKAAWIVFRP
jgi:hypothetical protein